MVIREIRPISPKKGIIRIIRPIQRSPKQPSSGGTGVPPEPVAGFPETPYTPEDTLMKGEVIHDYTQRIEQIDPTASYYLDETRTRTIEGQYLIQLLKKQQQTIKDYPRGTTFVKTSTGYKVRLPTTTSSVRPPSHPLVGGLAILASPEIAVTSLGGPTWKPGQPLYSKETWDVIESSRERIETKIETGDVLGMVGEVARVPVISAPLAYGAGFGLGLGFRGVGAAASVSKGFTAKVLGTFATRGPWVAGGTISGLVGADIGRTAAYEEHGLVPKGTTLTKTVLYGSQFYAAGLGAIRASTFKLSKQIFGKEAMVLMDEKGMVQALGGRKYINIFGKQFYYGKRWLGLPKDTMVGFQPKPTYPVKPSGLARAPTIYSHPPMGKPLVPIAFKGRYTFITPTDLQPSQPYEPSPFEIITKVWPRPKLYRSYETYFRVITYTPPSEPIVSITKKPVFLKQPVHKTARDIIKPDVTKDVVSGGRVKTILKPPITKIITEKIVVPKQLLKPVYRRAQVQMQKPEKLQMFRGLKKTIHKQRVEQQKQLEQSFGIIALQKQRQQFAKETSFDRMLRFDTVQIFGQPSMVGQTIGQAQMKKQSMHQYFKQGLVNIIPYEQTRQVIPREPIIPKEPVTRPPRVPRVPRLPDMDGRGEQPDIDLFPRSYLVQTKIRTHYKGKKVKKDKWITKDKPLNKMDAMAFGAHLTEHSAKASFRLVPSNRKPQRLGKSITNWLLMGDQYYNRDNLFIEQNIHRINTPGEINQISKLGWNAPRKKRRRNRRIRFNV